MSIHPGQLRVRDAMLEAAPDPFAPLTDPEREELLRLARKAVESIVLYRAGPDLALSTPALLAPGGAFVTIRLDGALRGCIGAVAPPDPLYATVIRMAQASTHDDPRFPPVTPDEVERITIEISRLSPPRSIAPDAVDPTRHGLYVVRDSARGLLLPQVSIRLAWTREQFLSETCLKAGLAADAWREIGTTLFAFEAEVFSESVRP